MNLNEAFPSKYLKSDSDVPEEGEIVLTITRVEMETVGQGAKAERKPVIYFRETDKGLTCNVTNGKTIGKLHGNDTDDWIGKRIALYSADVQYGSEMVRGIRVKTRAPKSTAAEPVAKSRPAPVITEEDDDSIPF